MDKEKLYSIFVQLKQSYRDYLTFDELSVAVQRVFPNLTDEKFIMLYKIFDANGDDVISYSEFQHFCMTVLQSPYPGDDEVCFQLADSNGSGFIDKSQLANMLNAMKMQLTNSEINELFTFYAADKKLNISMFK